MFYPKKLLIILLAKILLVAGKTRLGAFIYQQILDISLEKTVLIQHKGIMLNFMAPNPLCAWRAQTFSSKEPETLEWIDQIPERAIFWDVGANVGLYTCYAAKKARCRVVAVEPSFFNLEFLARNISKNELSERVNIVPLALSNQTKFSNLRFTSTKWGGALSTFDKDFGWDGETIDEVFKYTTLGFSLDQLVEVISDGGPNYIKIDVDGLEHLILEGGTNSLKNVKEILIEVNDNFVEQANAVEKLLVSQGFSNKGKYQSDLIKKSTVGLDRSYNQLWIK